MSALLTETRFIIKDPPRSPDELPGYAVHDPINGWILTYLLSHATTFETAHLAAVALLAHYREADRLGLRVCAVEVSQRAGPPYAPRAVKEVE